mmetsp:Transcript_12640/g.33485  ORF Transcript_12640/g.33485 Transcript_12640/m.33485 type:complete len:211 (-) Transcript_12640:281-913(-)
MLRAIWRVSFARAMRASCSSFWSSRNRSARSCLALLALCVSWGVRLRERGESSISFLFGTDAPLSSLLPASSPNTAMYAPGLECSSGVSALGPSSEAAAPAGSAPVLAATAPAPALVLMEGTAAIAASAAAASTSASSSTCPLASVTGSVPSATCSVGRPFANSRAGEGDWKTLVPCWLLLLPSAAPGLLETGSVGSWMDGEPSRRGGLL